MEADLRGADLREAHLDGTYMAEARLEGAYLGGAHLDGAYMYKANLEGASLHAARVVSTIGVHRDERERVNRTAAAHDGPPAQPGESATPARPTVLRRARR